jgi:PST family polysaccharide transporter
LKEESVRVRAEHARGWRLAHLVVVNAVFVLRLLVLARLLDPTSFGLFAVAMIPIGLLLGATELGFSAALVHAQTPSSRMYHTAWTAMLVRGLGIAGLILFGAPFIAELAGSAEAAPYIQVLALHPVLVCLSSIRLADLQRDLNFKPLALMHISEALVNATVAMLLAPSYGAWALVAGLLASSVCKTILSYVIAPYVPRIEFQDEAVKRLVTFGGWVFATAMASTLAASALQVIISRKFGAAELGIYYMATRLVFLVFGNLVDLSNSVAFPVYASLQKRREDAAVMFRLTLRGALVVIVPIFSLACVLASPLVTLVLGPKWTGSEALIQILSLVCIGSVLGDLCNALWSGTGEPWRTTAAELLQMVVLLIAAWYLIDMFGLLGVAMAWMLAILVTQVLATIFLRKTLIRPFERMSGFVAALSCAVTALATSAWVVSCYIDGLAGLISAVMVGLIAYVALLQLLDRRFDLAAFESVASILSRRARSAAKGNV